MTTVAARAIDLLDREHEHARALACVASLATRVEPTLLRRLRLRFVPAADAGLEADLSLSPVVGFRSRDGFVFDPDVANALRAELARDSALLRQVWEETERAHRHLPLAIRLEEELAYLLLCDDDASRERIRVLLRAAVTALVTGADGLAHWAARALPRFPPALFGAFEEARMLHAGAVTRLDPRLDEVIPADRPLPSWLGWVAPPAAGRVRTHVRLFPALVRTPNAGGFQRRLEIGTPEAVPSGAELYLPATDPLVVEVIAGDGAPSSSTHSASAARTIATLRFSPDRQGSASALVPDAPLRLRTLLGDEHLLEASATVSARTAGDIIDFSGERQRHEPFLNDGLLGEAASAIEGGLERGELSKRGVWMLIAGEPGSGKSALFAAFGRTLEERGIAVVHHFFRSDVPDWRDPTRAARSISAQIEARFPFAASERPPSATPARWLNDQLDRFDRQRSGKRLAIVLDAVDEAQMIERPLADFFPERLPPGVAIVASLRTSPDPIAVPDGTARFSLDEADQSERRSAIARYFVFRQLPHIEAPGLSNGNWTYAAMLADLLKATPQMRLDDLQPGNISSLTLHVLRHLSRDPAVVSAVVAVAREPVPDKLVRRCLGLASGQNIASMNQNPGTRSGEKLFEIPSADALIVKIRQGGTTEEALTIRAPEVRLAALSSIDGLRAHRVLQAAMQEGLEEDDPFSRRHLLFHAAKAGNGTLVRKLTRDVEELARKAREAGIDALLEDLQTCEREIGGVLDLEPRADAPGEAEPRSRRQAKPKARAAKRTSRPKRGGKKR